MVGLLVYTEVLARLGRRGGLSDPFDARQSDRTLLAGAAADILSPLPDESDADRRRRVVRQSGVSVDQMEAVKAYLLTVSPVPAGWPVHPWTGFPAVYTAACVEYGADGQIPFPVGETLAGVYEVVRGWVEGTPPGWAADPAYRYALRVVYLGLLAVRVNGGWTPDERWYWAEYVTPLED